MFLSVPIWAGRPRRSVGGRSETLSPVTIGLPSERTGDVEPTAALEADAAPVSARASRKRLAFLCLTALGVVYGDIGTSPLYALRECFHGAHAIPPTQANVLGVLSLVVWALIIVVTLKYHVYVLRADNHGEGGILALMALARSDGSRHRREWVIVALGLFGAALLYGDGMITPAISVLSAVEGLEVATPELAPFVVPLTVAILVALFAFQRHGTAGVGTVFGPIILVWFATLALLGVAQILREPSVLRAVNPLYGVDFFLRNGVEGFLVLGAVFLVATGGEALYADLGHFGELPIQIDWFGIVFLSLVLNYFGQGALLLAHPEAAVNPFYLLAPRWALVPLVTLATMATVIASQAVISGVFSLTRQAVQLGYFPRVRIVHTSSREEGQIYLPAANFGLMVATVALVLAFQKSGALAAAYGIAVTMTMIITTLLAYVVARRLWRWSRPLALLVTGLFLIADLGFFGANVVKVAQGGWVPLLIGAIVFLVFRTWWEGREDLAQRRRSGLLPLDLFLRDPSLGRTPRVPGTAVFMTGDPAGIPLALLHNLKHNRVLHDRVALLTVASEDVPHVSPAERLAIEDLGAGFHRLTARYGFMENPSALDILETARRQGFATNLAETSFFLGRETLVPARKPTMPFWRRMLFSFLSRNSLGATAFFGIPPNRVVELGEQIEV
jgi:KUP system potassium uptake protein